LSALPASDLPIAWKAATDEIAQQHKQNDYRTNHEDESEVPSHQAGLPGSGSGATMATEAMITASTAAHHHGLLIIAAAAPSSTGKATFAPKASYCGECQHGMARDNARHRIEADLTRAVVRL
jgi:hypothetical protein